MKKRPDTVKVLICIFGVLAAILLGLIAVTKILPVVAEKKAQLERSVESEVKEKEPAGESIEDEEEEEAESREEELRAEESSKDAEQEESSRKTEASAEEVSKTVPEDGAAGDEIKDHSSEDLTELELAEILDGMTLEEKVGQMILARCPGPDSAAYYAGEYQLGGYVLFDSDFRSWSADEVRDYIDDCQEASRIPMLMSVDEEGGTVTRVSDYFRDAGCFRSPRDVYEDGGWEGIEEDLREKCELLLSLHLNMNLAPVADIAGNYDDFMYLRSFSGDPEMAAEFIIKAVTIMNEYGVACSLKHFPGYGNNVDTHVGAAQDERSTEKFYEEDLVPFMAGIEAGAGTIMVSHNIVTAFDDDRPASLSPRIHELARSLGFEGVMITDDLAMGAITDFCGEVDAAVWAVQAGNDMLITSDFTTQYEAVLSAVEEGVIPEERINESVLRILKLKRDMGLI